MIRGTTPPQAGTPLATLWKRESDILERLIALPRSRRRAAVEATCSCPKRHLVLSAFRLPDDQVAIWLHGGGRAPSGYMEGPAVLTGDLPKWFTMPDNLDIRELAHLRGGGWIGNVWPRCGLPHTLQSAEVVSIAAAIDRWEDDDAPVRATFDVTPA